MVAARDFNFVIPVNLESLKQATSTHHYAVSYVSSTKEIPRRLIGELLIFFNICY